jgi:kynurenine 3-monooxygenase
MPYGGHPSFSSITTEDDLMRLFRCTFSDALPLMPTLVHDFFAHPPTWMITVRCSPWTHEGRVALIGDAAHAIVPSYGQGANSGFEDCAVLADCLAAAGGGWEAALADYQRRRKPNADAIADLALDHFHELRHRVGDPEFLLRKEVERRLAEVDPQRFTPLYALVSFTSVPYVEARRRGEEQEELVSWVMAQPRFRERLADEKELRRLLESLPPGAGGAGGNGGAAAPSLPDRR